MPSDKTDDDLFACHGFCDRPGFNRKSKVMITSRDVFDSLEPSRKLALWAYAKRVHGKHNLFHFTFKGTVFFSFGSCQREPRRNPLFIKFLKKPKKVHQKSCIMTSLYFPVQESRKLKKWKMKTTTRKPKRSFESKKRHFWRFWNINSRTVDHIIFSIWTISNYLTHTIWPIWYELKTIAKKLS